MVGVSFVLFRSLVMKPFRTLVDGARLVPRGEYQHQIDLGPGDELSELATVLKSDDRSLPQDLRYAGTRTRGP